MSSIKKHINTTQWQSYLTAVDRCGDMEGRYDAGKPENLNAFNLTPMKVRQCTV